MNQKRDRNLGFYLRMKENSERVGLIRSWRSKSSQNRKDLMEEERDLLESLLVALAVGWRK
jgi:hypothetical protein